jgi:predicted MFS family arabinose efflux permease
VQAQAQSVDVNSAGSLVATIHLAVIGAAVFIVQPGFVQGLVDYYGFSERQAGYTASAEVWGIAAASIFLAFGGHRHNWRSVLHYALLLFVCGNLLSILTSAHTLFSGLRFIAGLGSGAMISLTFTIMGLTRHPDRNFGYLVAAVLVYAAIVLWVMPWFALRYMPRSSQEQPRPAEDAVDLARGYRILALLAMFVFFLAQGGIWAYLFLIGLGGGLAEQEVANGLMLSGLVGIAGAFVPVIIGGRFGRALPLAVSILYGLCWNMSHPYLLASVASFDRGGHLVTHAVAAQMSGLAIGPAVSACLLVDGNYTPVIWTGVSVFVLSYALILVPLLAHGRQKNR